MATVRTSTSMRARSLAVGRWGCGARARGEGGGAARRGGGGGGVARGRGPGGAPAPPGAGRPPAGPNPPPRRKLAEVCPQRVGGDVLDDDLLPAERRGAARP